MQVPPPVTGHTLRNSGIVDIFSNEDDFNTKLIPISFENRVSKLSTFSFRKIFKSCGLYLKTMYHLISFSPDLVYLTPVPTGFAYWRDIFLVLIIKVFRKKRIFHLRPLGFRRMSDSNRVRRALNKFMFRNASVICLSGITAGDIKGVFTGTPHILNNGIEVVDVEPAGTGGGPPVLLFLSNLFVAKGVLDFLEMLVILKNRGEKFAGKIYGEEGDISVERLETRIKDMGLEDHAAYMGSVSGNDKYKVFGEADVFVFPTHRENFPGVVLEAMQSSLPVVSVTEGSIPEMVTEGKTGFLHPKGDHVNAAFSISALLRNRALRKKMGAAGKEVFMKKFTFEVFRRNIIRLIKRETDIPS